MFLIILTGLFLVLSVYLSRVSYYKSSFNPVVLFFAVWFICFLLYGLDLYPELYVVGLSFYAKRLFVESFAALFLGFVCCEFILNRKVRKPDPGLPVTDKEVFILFNISKVLLYLFVLLVLSFTLLIYLHYGSLYVSPAVIKTDIIGLKLFKLPLYIKILRNLGLVLALNAVILLLSYKRLRFLLLTAVICIFWLYLDFSMGSWFAGYFIFFCVISILIYTFKGKGIKEWSRYFSKIFSLFLAFFMFLLLVLYQRGAYLGFHDYIQHPLPPKRSAFMHLYMYVTGNIPSFSYVAENPFPTEFFGHYTFAFIYRPINYITRNIAGFDFAGTTEDYYQTYVRIFENINKPFNSTPYLGFIYSDFGEVGVIFCSLLIGVIFTLIYRNFIVNRRIVDFQILLFIMIQIPLMIRSAPYSAIEFWVQLSFILIQHLFLCWKYPRLAQARLDFIFPDKAVSA